MATATVIVLAGWGPEWPDTFADCSDDPGRPQAIEEWRDWFLPVYLAALAISTALVVAAVPADARRARLGIAVSVATALVLASAAVAHDPAAFGAIIGIPWFFVLGFPDLTPILAPPIYAGSVWLMVAVSRRLGERGRRVALVNYVVVLAWAWTGLLGAGFVAEGAFAC